MTSANADLVRRACEDFNRAGFDTLLAYADPTIEFSELPQAPEHTLRSGHEEILSWASQFEDVWDEVEAEIVELTEVDAERLIAVLRLRAHARDSGIELEQTSGSLFTFRDGVVVRWEVYPTKGEALRAAGLAT
jgi:ketosteroid isomerase-like protein